MNHRRSDRKQARYAKLEARRMDAWLTKRKPLPRAQSGQGQEWSIECSFNRRERVIETLPRQASTR